MNCVYCRDLSRSTCCCGASGPGTQPVDEYYRNLHPHWSDSLARSIRVRTDPSMVHRDSMGLIVRVGPSIIGNGLG